ncbi:MAG: hypothetical protein IJQ21_12270 [Lachnospiraceae bacterium]|nr:hypothetical protein [Lachnospiraceae bacterium]
MIPKYLYEYTITYKRIYVQKENESLMFNYLVILMALVLLTQLYVGDKRRVRK